MPIGTRYVFIASMDVDPDKEDLFNEVYDTEHVPYLLDVPGVVAVTRLKAQDFEVSMGGELKSVPRGETPDLARDLRDREPRGHEKRGVGGGGRAWALAERGAPAHAQPPALSPTGDGGVRREDPSAEAPLPDFGADPLNRGMRETGASNRTLMSGTRAPALAAMH